VPAASSSLLDAMLSGMVKATEKDLEPHVSPRRPLRLAPGDNWAEVTSLLVQACGSDSLTRAINGRATVAQMLEVSPTPQERAARFRQVFVLMSTMAVRASESVIPVAQAQPAPARTPTPAPSPSGVSSGVSSSASSSLSSSKGKPSFNACGDAGLTFNANEQDARARIEAKFKEIEGKNHWEVLGVKRDVDGNGLKKAFYALSRDFHPDSFAGMQLGAAQQKLESVFSTIQEAYATLTDPNKKGEYEAKMSLEAGGGSSDVAAIFGAEHDFAKAKTIYDRGDFAGAQKIIDRVAIIMASHEEVRGYKLFLDWWQTKNAATGEKVIRELQGLYKAAPAQHALLDFQGWIYMEMGNFKYAKATFKKVLEAEPKHIGANRGLTAVNRKIDDGNKPTGGGLGKLFGGKS